MRLVIILYQRMMSDVMINGETIILLELKYSQPQRLVLPQHLDHQPTRVQNHYSRRIKTLLLAASRLLLTALERMTLMRLSFSIVLSPKYYQRQVVTSQPTHSLSVYTDQGMFWNIYQLDRFTLPWLATSEVIFGQLYIGYTILAAW